MSAIVARSPKDQEEVVEVAVAVGVEAAVISNKADHHVAEAKVFKDEIKVQCVVVIVVVIAIDHTKRVHCIDFDLMTAIKFYPIYANFLKKKKKQPINNMGIKYQGNFTICTKRLYFNKQ